jgi:hypothetical protein
VAAQPRKTILRRSNRPEMPFRDMARLRREWERAFDAEFIGLGDGGEAMARPESTPPRTK